MSLPTKEELLSRITFKPEVMEARRYPLDYAEELLLEHPEIMSEELRHEVMSSMRNAFTKIYAPLVLDWWAEKEGVESFPFATVLADAYLELKGITRIEGIPELKSRYDWMEWMSSRA